MKEIKNWLNKPYFFMGSQKYKFLLALKIGLFVFLFLYIFEPFGITNIAINKLFYTAGFGFVTILIQFLFFLILPNFFKNFFKNENWTVGKNIIFLLLLVITITIGNIYYNSLVIDNKIISFIHLKSFLLRTFTIAIFPIIITIYLKEKISRTQREKVSSKLMKLKNLSDEIDRINEKIIIFSDNNQSKINFKINDLVYVTSQGNYASFFICEDEKNIKEFILRTTLSKINNKMEEFPNIVRCHKSYIINSDYIYKFSGNSRGYLLNIKLVNFKIPVSRNFNIDSFKK